MQITRRSMFSGKRQTMDIAIDEDQLARIDNRREPIQQVAPQLTPDEREFLMTGVTPEEWDAEFSEEEG